jgi:hypothetical protein
MKQRLRDPNRAYVVPRSKSKYGAMPTRIDGHRFASKKEGMRYVLLKDMANRGEIEELELQPRFAIEIKGRKICTYVADFQYRLDGDLVVEDVKGVRTPVYRLKKKMVEAVYDFAITEI